MQPAQVNAFFYLPSVSGLEVDDQDIYLEARFAPSQRKVDSNSIEISDLDLVSDELVKEFSNAVMVNNNDLVWKILTILISNRPYLVKALLETAVYCIGPDNLKLMNTIFATVDEDINAIEIVAITQMMLEATKNKEFYDFMLNPRPLPNPKTQVMEDHVPAVSSLFQGLYTLDELFEGTQDIFHENYRKISYCEVAFWYYPIYCESTIKRGILKRTRNAVIPLIKPTGFLSRKVSDLERALTNGS